MHDPSRSQRSKKLSGSFVQTNNKMPVKEMDYVRCKKEQIHVVKPCRWQASVKDASDRSVWTGSSN